MCDSWKNSFDEFRKWALENGYNENADLSIDRIDNDGDYSPQNCRFTTAQEQALNRENSLLLEYQGRTYTPYGLSKEFGMSQAFVLKRVRNGVEPDAIVEEWNKCEKTPSYLMTLSEAAKKYGKTEGHIRRMLRDGKLKGERINWKWYVDKNQS